jgi:hypothetical protein
MQNVFKMNDPHWVEEVPSDFFGVPFYTIDNFYQDPDAIVDLINSKEPTMFLGTTDATYNTASLNGKYFTDQRHYIEDENLEYVHYYLSHFFKMMPIENTRVLQTNQQQLIDRDYNQWQNNYWYPHLDQGWTAVVYLNKNGCDGTNLYSYKGQSKIVDKQTRPWMPNVNEHEGPWQDKRDWEVIHTIPGIYNRCAIFHGNIYHGLAINSDQLFNEHRLNQVMFFAGDLHSQS